MIAANAKPALSEGIDRISFDARPYHRLQAMEIGNIDPHREKIGEVLGNPDILEQIDLCLGRQLDQDIDVTGRRRLIAGHRTEQTGMQDTALAQLVLVLA